MNNNDKLKGIVSGILGVNPGELHDEFSAADSDTWDSLNHINLITAVEEEFDVRFPTESMERTKSIGSIKSELVAMGIAFDG